MRLLLMLVMLAPVRVGAQGLATMVSELTAGIGDGSPVRVAVLEFPYVDERPSQGPAVIQERITTALVKKRLATVVERKLLDRVMAELRLQHSGVMDGQTIKRIGKVLGADYVMTGTLNDVGNGRTEVNARLIDAENAGVISASSAEIARTWKDGPPEAAKPLAPPEAAPYVVTKAAMDARLAELKRGVGTSIVPGADGRVSVNGTAVTYDAFNKAVMKAITEGTALGEE